MKNKEVIRNFLNKCEAINHHGSLRSAGDRLFSYNTCIAQWVDDIIWVNVSRYSTTTSGHRNSLISACNVYCFETRFVENVPINTKYLWKDKEKM